MLKLNLTKAQYFALAFAVATMVEELIRSQVIPAEYAGAVVGLVVFVKSYIARAGSAPESDSTPSGE
jgi:hypothetical protein